MPSDELLLVTNQKYFDRRIRELRDELGYDIETKVIDGKHCYRLKSSKRKPPKPRTYLLKSEKSKFLENNAVKCNLCEKHKGDLTMLVYDHRIPLIRGGEGNISNFQFLCRDCNNQKRGYCKGCSYECKKCYFAFPENYPPAIILNIGDKEIENKLKATALSHNMAIEEFILKVIKNNIK